MTCTLDVPAGMVARSRRAQASTDLTELAELGERICEMAGHLAAATGAWLALVAEFDRRDGWAEWGVKSCAHWLSWKCGIGLVAGREHVRVARALTDFPALAAELTAGQLSYSKVRALTRVITPESEADLIQVARSSTGAQLEDLVRGLRRAGSLDDVNKRHQARHLSLSWAEDGSLAVRGRLDPEDGALLIAALEAARRALAKDENENENENENEKPSGRQRNADGLVLLAETFLASGPAAAPGGDRYQVNIHADLDALLEEKPNAAPGRIEDGPDLHPETLRRLCCDSGAVIVAHHRGRRRGTWMDVGRRTRVVPAALRRALVLRDGGCRFPGCTETRFVDAHHVIFWRHHGETALHNLVLICRRHHRAVHEGGFRAVGDDSGSFVFYRPDGTLLAEAPRSPGGNAQALPGLHSATITAQTTMPDWYGDRLDLHYAVAVLSQPYASAESRPTAAGLDPTLN